MLSNFKEKKVSKIFHNSLEKVFSENLKRIFINDFITVTHVKFFKNLNLLKVYLSFGVKKNNFIMLHKIEKYNFYIRKLLSNSIKINKKIKKVPLIKFYIDDSF